MLSEFMTTLSPELQEHLPRLLLFIAIGFGAQLVDGAIGMAYGLTATSIMISTGTPPAVASASVHVAEVFTTGVSGFSHWRMKNVDMALFKRLVLPGMLGGAAGAWLLTSIPTDWVRPMISVYLIAMACVILYKATHKPAPEGVPYKHVGWLGLFGGCLDAVGGGGWGPMVATTLVGRGAEPRLAIGSTNLAEFFVATVISTTFVATIGIQLWPTIAGLVIGGVFAAPLAALATKKLPAKGMMIIVACVIIGLSGYNLYTLFGG